MTVESGMASQASAEEYRAVTPQRIKGVGLTWVKRGTGYWVLRVLLAGARLLIVLLLAIGAAAGLSAALSSSLSSTARTAIYVGTGILFLLGAALGIREAHASNASDLTPEERRAAAREMRRRNWPFRIPYLLNFLFIMFLPVTGPMALGFALTWLPGVSLGRELPEERGARLDLERRQQQIDADNAELRGMRSRLQ
jgi:hypothetical protein